MFGLMTKKAHKEEVEFQKEMRAGWKASAKDWEAKFKKAITDLEGEIRDRKKVQYDLALARLEVEALRPDAEKWRARLRRDRERRKRGRA